MKKKIVLNSYLGKNYPNDYKTVLKQANKIVKNLFMVVLNIPIKN